MADEKQDQATAPSKLGLVLKYGSAIGLMGSLFALALIGKVPVSEYTGLAYGILAGLGVHATIRN